MVLSEVTYTRYQALFAAKALSQQELDQVAGRSRVPDLAQGPDRRARDRR